MMILLMSQMSLRESFRTPVEVLSSTDIPLDKHSAFSEADNSRPWCSQSETEENKTISSFLPSHHKCRGVSIDVTQSQHYLQPSAIRKAILQCRQWFHKVPVYMSGMSGYVGSNIMKRHMKKTELSQ